MKQAGSVGRFVGTVTDFNFLKAVDELPGASEEEKRTYMMDIREGVIEYFDMICAVAEWQLRRVYWDEIKNWEMGRLLR